MKVHKFEVEVWAEEIRMDKKQRIQRSCKIPPP